MWLGWNGFNGGDPYFAGADATAAVVNTNLATAVAMMHASGARRVRAGLQYAAHAMGSCRMGDDPRTSVVNSFGQAHDLRNLFLCDTSVFVTSAGVNPTLTAMAIASRSAGYIAAAAKRGEL